MISKHRWKCYIVVKCFENSIKKSVFVLCACVHFDIQSVGSLFVFAQLYKIERKANDLFIKPQTQLKLALNHSVKWSLWKTECTAKWIQTHTTHRETHANDIENYAIRIRWITHSLTLSHWSCWQFVWIGSRRIDGLFCVKIECHIADMCCMSRSSCHQRDQRIKANGHKPWEAHSINSLTRPAIVQYFSLSLACRVVCSHYLIEIDFY